MPLTPRFIKRIATAAATLIVTGAFAADFPAKAVRIITPFPPGGSVDLVARLFAADMSKTWGQQ
ncbi:MAG: tripartite tricarboxylate transporter substrate binding protein, partial [Proteobacteria bacterium]|nr:tripartite tricarboxylate transporter substrate binding protein [Pseudomonadota bacterium]